jgi:hypothetical protein
VKSYYKPRGSAATEKTLDYVGAYGVMIRALAGVGREEGGLTPEESQLIADWKRSHKVGDYWTSEWAGTVWELRRVPVRTLHVDRSYYIDQEKIRRYVNTPSGRFPPLLLHPDGHPIDGQHRLLAAKRRGDKTIMAWVPR